MKSRKLVSSSRRGRNPYLDVKQAYSLVREWQWLWAGHGWNGTANVKIMIFPEQWNVLLQIDLPKSAFSQEVSSLGHPLETFAFAIEICNVPNVVRPTSPSSLKIEPQAMCPSVKGHSNRLSFAPFSQVTQRQMLQINRMLRKKQFGRDTQECWPPTIFLGSVTSDKLFNTSESQFLPLKFED